MDGVDCISWIGCNSCCKCLIVVKLSGVDDESGCSAEQ